MLLFDAADATIVAAALTFLGTAGLTAWNKRGRGPDAVGSLVSTSTELLAEMRAWNNTLLLRISKLERDLYVYRTLYGPLGSLGDEADEHDTED